MTSKFELIDTTARRDYGFARVRDLAFDAVRELWAKRQGAGMKQTELAARLGRDTAWVSKKLKGPGNWTLRTFGELVEALDGDAEIIVVGLETPLRLRPNFDAYAASYGTANGARVQMTYQTPVNRDWNYNLTASNSESAKAKLEAMS